MCAIQDFNCRIKYEKTKNGNRAAVERSRKICLLARVTLAQVIVSVKQEVREATIRSTYVGIRSSLVLHPGT